MPISPRQEERSRAVCEVTIERSPGVTAGHILGGWQAVARYFFFVFAEKTTQGPNLHTLHVEISPETY